MTDTEHQNMQNQHLEHPLILSSKQEATKRIKKSANVVIKQGFCAAWWWQKPWKALYRKQFSNVGPDIEMYNMWMRGIIKKKEKIIAGSKGYSWPTGGESADVS